MTRSIPGTLPPAFPTSILIRYQDFDFELMPDSVSRFRESLEALQDGVLEIAARSRGWHGVEDLTRFREVFKLEPLFAANGLALIWRERRLVGLVGVTYDLPVEDGVIFHVGSLGLLPEAQNRGFLPTLFSLLWEAVRQNVAMRDSIDAGHAYLTAITQSPFIISFLASVSDLYPWPGHSAPEPDLIPVAEQVVKRFDPDVAFDRKTFVLRNECQFFYRQIPYSIDKRVNEYCDRMLRYGEGDTFVVVGRVRQDAVARFVELIESGQQELFGLLRDGLRELGRPWPARAGDSR